MAAKKKLNIGLLGAAAAGGLAVGFVGKSVLPQLGLPSQITPFVPVALGVILTMQKNPMLQGLGIGMIGSAAPDALQAVGINIGNVLPAIGPFTALPAGSPYNADLTENLVMTGNNPAYSPVTMGGNQPQYTPVTVS